MRVERLRRETLVCRFGGEREVHLASALAEQLCFFRINAADQFLEQRTRGDGSRLQIALLRQDPFVVAADRIERQRPRVAFVRRGRLQERDHGRLGTLTPIFDRANKCGHVRELLVLLRNRVISTSGFIPSSSLR